MNILIMGPQASGKGTQSKMISEKMGFAYFEAGEILRRKAKQKTPLGQKINVIINQKGELVPDEIIVDLLRDWLKDVDPDSGIIFDGFPRSKAQYELMRETLKQFGLRLDLAVFLKVRRKISLQRLGSRRVCPDCDREYNLLTRPPKNDSLCDRCQVDLVKRKDDAPALINKRLSIYEGQTRPLLDTLEKEKLLVEIDGEKSVEEIFKRIRSVIEAKKKG